MKTSSSILRIGKDRLPDVVDVLCDAFADYPVMRYVLDGRDESYERRLRTLIHFLVMARVLRDEPMLGIADGARLGGAATVSYPKAAKSAELNTLRESVWAELGPAARERYEAFGTATSAFSIDAPHVELNMIGVRAAVRGTGLGRRLLTAVHRLSHENPRSEGVKLTTEDPENVRLYERFGYRVIGQAHVAPNLETWGMFRPDQS